MTTIQVRAQLSAALREFLEEVHAEVATLMHRRHAEYQRILGLLAQLTGEDGSYGYPSGNSLDFSAAEFLVQLIQGQLGPPRL